MTAAIIFEKFHYVFVATWRVKWGHPLRTPSEDTHWGHPVRTPLYTSVSITTTQIPTLKISATTTQASWHSQCLGPLTFHALVQLPQKLSPSLIQREELFCPLYITEYQLFNTKNVSILQCTCAFYHKILSPIQRREERGPLLQHITHLPLTSAVNPITNTMNFPILQSILHSSISPLSHSISNDASDQHQQFPYPPYHTCHSSLLLHCLHHQPNSLIRSNSSGYL